MNCSSNIGFEVVKLAFGHFASKIQTSSRFPNDSQGRLFYHIKIGEIGEKIFEVKKGRPLGH